MTEDDLNSLIHYDPAAALCNVIREENEGVVVMVLLTR